MTPPSNITVSAGIDQTTNSRRPSLDSPGVRLARGLDDRYHQANANVATITTVMNSFFVPQLRWVG